MTTPARPDEKALVIVQRELARLKVQNEALKSEFYAELPPEYWQADYWRAQREEYAIREARRGNFKLLASLARRGQLWGQAGPQGGGIKLLADRAAGNAKARRGKPFGPTGHSKVEAAAKERHMIVRILRQFFPGRRD